MRTTKKHAAIKILGLTIFWGTCSIFSSHKLETPSWPEVDSISRIAKHTPTVSQSLFVEFKDNHERTLVLTPVVKIHINGYEMICPKAVQQLALNLLKVQDLADRIHNKAKALENTLKKWHCTNAEGIDRLIGDNLGYQHLKLSLRYALDLEEGDLSKWDFNLSQGGFYETQINDTGYPGAVWKALGPYKGDVRIDSSGNIFYSPKQSGWDTVSWFAIEKGLLTLVTKSIYVNPPFNTKH